MRTSFTYLFFILLLFIVSCTDEPDRITNIIGPEDWQGPELSWLSPPEAEVRGTVGLDIQISDSSAIDRATLYIDGVSRNELTSAPWRFEIITDSLEDGVHVAEVRAWDEYGNLGISPILRVNVMNSMAEGPRLLWVPDDYTTIQSAINAAQDFDTIRVRDGVYYETLNLFGKGLWIESENGPVRCTVDGDGAHNTIFTASSREYITIRGFTIIGSGGIAVEFDDGASFTFVNNSLESESSVLMYARRTAGTVHNNLFLGANVSLEIWSLQGTVFNNVFMDAITAALWNTNYGRNPVAHGYNLFWQNQSNYYEFDPAISDIYLDPLIDIEAGELRPNSPCIDAGNPTILDIDSTTSDIGPFGGPLAYP
jgi:hypothetical protein